MAELAASSSGFDRAEMFQSPLAGSVSFYQRHFFVCFKDALSWPSQVESAELGGLPHALFAAVKARKSDIPNKIRVTVCEGSDATNGDILIFPDLVRYRGLRESDLESFVEEVVVKEQAWSGGVEEALSGSHVFVCAHGARDARCGSCGPALITKFRDEIAARGLSGSITVKACSHIGGHKFAGNVIIYSASAGGGPVAGHWYGYVTPGDVSLLLEQHIGRGRIVDKLWRGQMGRTEDQQRESQERRAAAGEDSYACPCGVMGGGICAARQQLKRGPGTRGVAVAAKAKNSDEPEEEAANAVREDVKLVYAKPLRKASSLSHNKVAIAVLVIGAATAIAMCFNAFP